VNNKKIILEKLKEIRPQGLCDDCLAELLNIFPRQQTNRICNELAEKDDISRRKDCCMRKCEKASQHKYVNFAKEFQNRLESDGQLAEINKQAKMESIKIYNDLPLWIRTAFRNIPYIGTNIDYVMSQKGMKFYKNRIEIFLDNLATEIERLDESKINKEFIQTEEFFEIIRQAIEYSTKAIDNEKILEYAKIVRSSVEIDFVPVMSPSEMLYVFSGMSKEQVIVLRAINMAIKNGATEIQGYGKSIEAFISIELHSDLMFHIKRIESAGLLTEKTGAILSYSGGSYTLTPTGRKLLDYINDNRL